MRLWIKSVTTLAIRLANTESKNVSIVMCSTSFLYEVDTLTQPLIALMSAFVHSTIILFLCLSLKSRNDHSLEGNDQAYADMSTT